MFAEGEILTGVQQQTIVIPAAAVYRNDGSAKDPMFCRGEQQGGPAQRPPRPRTGLQTGDHGGLKPGDLLVAEQSIELAEGVRVEPGK